MRCEELREWLNAELDGEARPREQMAVRRHLAACADCRRAQAAAETLRQELAQAAWALPNDERDESVLAVLRHEGFLRAASAEVAGGRIPVRTQSMEDNPGDLACRSADARPLRWGLGRIPGGLRSGRASAFRQNLHLRSMIQMCGSLRPAFVAMVVSFLVTWGSLRWAETGRAGVTALPASLSAATPARPPDAEMIDKWMAGAPTLAALSRLQRLPAPAPAAPEPTRRGAAARQQRRVG